MRIADKSSIAAAVLALALPLGCAGGDETAQGTPGATASPSARNRGAPEAPAEGLDLAAMVAPVPEYEGSGRNLFAYGPERPAAAPPDPPAAPPRVAPPPRAAPPPAPVAPPTARLDVKYAGFLEKTQADGAKAKYAIFLDGNEILAGAEGETVGNRFKVVEIGLESVTVASMGSDVTQRIPLQSN